MSVIAVVVSFLLSAAPALQPALPPALPPSPVPAQSRQLLTVTTDTWSATSGHLQRFERRGRAWRPVGGAVPVRVGRSGMGWGLGLHPPAAAGSGEPVKREGDGRAPAGVFRLSAAFGYAANEPTGLPYIPTDGDTECVDDTASQVYNRVTRRTPASAWGSHEEMRLDAHIYRIGVVVAHNGTGVDAGLVPGLRGPQTQRGAGSCIFLHVWRTPETATSGCTSMPDAALQGVLAWLDAAAAPVLVQLPRDVYGRLARPWDLP